MSDDTQQGERRLGRSIQVLAFGDNPDEIEMDAIDGARRFFGNAVRLEVVRNYMVFATNPGSALAGEADGKAHHARVTVREPS